MYRDRQNLIWVCVGTLALVWLFRGEPPLRNMIVLVGGAVLVMMLWPDIKGWVKQPPRQAVERRAAPPKNDYAERVFGMTLDEARSRAWPTLERIYTLGAPDMELRSRATHLGPSLASLFLEYGTISSRYSESRLGAPEVDSYEPPIGQLMRFGVEHDRPSTRLIKIGRDADGNPLLTRPEQDTVYVVRRARATSDSHWLAEYPSIYHWLLMEHPDDRA